MNQHPLLARVHDLLDARLDPLADPAVRDGLRTRPDLLDVVVGLRAAARDLAGLRPGTAAPRRRVRWFAGTAAAAAVLAGAVAFGRPAPTAVDPTTHAGGRIVAASLEEIRPHGHVAAQFVVAAPVLTTASAHLESWTTRSTLR